MRERANPIPANIDDLIRRYEAGESAAQLAKELGVYCATVTGWFREMNVRQRSKSERSRLMWDTARAGDRIVVDIAEATRRYLAGESMKALAPAMGADRATLTRRLSDAGVPLRGRSASMFLRWEGIEDPASLCSAAWEAMRGSKRTATQQATHARGCQKSLHLRGKFEADVADGLAARGLAVTPQLAVGPYNLDIAINEPPIAVEIYTGGLKRNRLGRRSHLERAKDLLDDGWIFLRVNCKSSFDADGLCEYIVALADRASRDKTLRGRYGVVRGDGKVPPPRRSQFDDLPKIPSS
jgi:very-short-patch-repair endonuclease